jgi:hypothetical protein
MSTKVRFSFLSDAFSRRALIRRLAGLTVAGSSLAWLEACGAGGSTTTQVYPTFNVFRVISNLLQNYQNINLGSARDEDRLGPNILNFQPFWATDSNVPNSIEMHADGTIYAAYTHPLTPVWYDSNGDPEGAIDVGNRLIRAGASGTRRFQSLKSDNVNIHSRGYYTDNFPSNRRPATRWFTIKLPSKPPCDPDTGCTPRAPTEWSSFLRSGDPAVQKLIPHHTPSLPNSGNYCFRDNWLPIISENSGGPLEWMTILPVNDVFPDNGQRTYYPDMPDNAPGNNYVYWQALMQLMQNDPDRALEILAWRGRPSFETYKAHRVPWLPATVEGIVTNSFLSGDDYVGTHRGVPYGYWLGDPLPYSYVSCGESPSGEKATLCNDWIVYVEPDPEYHFLLGYDSPNHEGNFDHEHQGSQENEIEQWLIPGGYRPEPGDRISMTGRWVVDCGHDDWHTELHPYESFVSSHAQRKSSAIGGTEIVASVVVTAAWQGGTLELDIWPPARPSATARLRYFQDQPGAIFGLTVNESLSPQGNPNHLHLTVHAPYATLRTGTSNDVFYNLNKRLATKYHIWWE